jgi:hypothetical protein
MGRCIVRKNGNGSWRRRPVDRHGRRRRVVHWLFDGG